MTIPFEIPTTPIRRGRGHVRCASDPTPSTAASSIASSVFSTDCDENSDDDVFIDRVDSAVDSCSPPRTCSPGGKGPELVTHTVPLKPAAQLFVPPAKVAGPPAYGLVVSPTPPFLPKPAQVDATAPSAQLFMPPAHLFTQAAQLFMPPAQHFTPPAPLVAQKDPSKRSLAKKVRALGLNAHAQGAPNIKTTNNKLRGAQAIFPPEMCLFVGNLPAGWDDGVLYLALTYEFSQFGACTVGVFRKSVNKPYAIVQFLDIANAQNAFINGSGIWMERYLRVELSARAR